MFRNYVKIAVRQLSKNVTFSFINIAGLATGMAACMLLLLYIRHEMNYDRHHYRSGDIYLVNSEAVLSTGAKEEYPALSAPYASALTTAFPEIMQAARLYVMEEKTLLGIPGQPATAFYEKRGCQADTSFFSLFAYHFSEGDARNALREPGSIVLSATVAKKLFGDKPALHKIITLNGKETYRVSGVYRDESGRSHIDARFFIPLGSGWMGHFLRQPQHYAGNNIFYTYLRLHPGASAARLNRKLPAFMEQHAGAELKAAGFSKRIFLTPVHNLHLHDQLGTIVTATNSRAYLYMLASVALLILLIACVNFMNLSSARAVRRAAEVGIRKVLGAKKGELIRQFMGESLILALLALGVAFLLVWLVLPLFSQLTSRELSSALLLQPGVITAFILLAVLTGIVSGSYPAFFLAAFKPISVLKGRYANTMHAISFRRGLVVFQFVIAVGLILAAMVIRDQMHFIRHQPLGFHQDQQVVLPLNSEAAQQAYTGIRNSMLQHQQVLGAAGAVYYPGISNPTDFSFYRPDQTVNDIQHVRINQVAPELLETMGFRLAAGRGFTPADTSRNMIVNETTLRKFNIPADKAIGYKLNFDWEGVTYPYQIIGVVKDFHFEDLHKTITPYAFLTQPAGFNYLIVHVQTADMPETIASLAQQWKTILPEEPFEYSLLREDFQRNYHADRQTSRLLDFFTGIAIFISCMGLFGLAAFDAQQRIREIGIRKIMGGSVLHITTLLSKDFLRPVVTAILIAGPLAGICMQHWLNNFAYHTHVSGRTFLLAAMIAITMAVLTTGMQALRAALSNPVKNLREA
ncbi:FtsX-like permease family protein [Chitinophaga sp. Mgbs1]|uniref:FtsX-like permease family protein n=1 Tax=Chitinophaga solisilvae TaxID=1233460 RepID=A0A433WNR2_9BACT|nr:FtsX-like permease family protein [Chitinophaga solisilvae]